MINLFRKYNFILITLCISVLFVVGWSLNKGLVFSDEAFFLLHLDKSVKTIELSKWHWFARLLFNINDIVFNRIVIFALLITSNFILAKSLHSYFKSFPFLPIISILLIGQFSTITPVCLTSSYLTFNEVAFNILTALFFLFWNNKSPVYLVFIGILLAFLFLNIPTTVFVLIPFLGVTYFFENKSMIKLIKRVLLIFIGSLIAFIFYFIYFESVTIYIKGLNEAITYLNNDPKHNSFGLFKWHVKLIIYFLPFFIHLFLLHFGYNKIISNYFYLSLLSIWLIGSVYFAVTNGNYNFTLTSVYLILIHILYKLEIPNKIPLFFLMSIPYFASLGSDVNFMYRSAYYAGFIFFVGYYLFKINNNLFYKSIIISLFSVIIINFFTYPFRKNWGGYKLIDQKVSYNFNGFNLLIDSNRYDLLMTLYPIIKGRDVIIGHQSLYGYALLSGSNIKYLNFRFSLYSFNENLKRSNKPLFLKLKNKAINVDFKYLDPQNIIYTNEYLVIYQL